jgi:hypothetical protein
MSDWIPLALLAALVALSIAMIEGADRIHGSGKR